MKLILIASVAALLIGCSTTPTVNDGLTTGYATVTAVSNEVDVLLAAQVITQAQAAAVAKQITNVKAALDVASAAEAANQATAGNQLATALAAITALNAEVITLLPHTGTVQ